MNDRPDAASSADDSPEIAEVRRLLADARHTEPMPADLAHRLDGVLAGLAADESWEPHDSTPAAPVIEIAAHRRRRAAGLLVAAAAIVVGGVVAAQNVHLSTTNSSASSAGVAAPEGADSVTGAPPGHTGVQHDPKASSTSTGDTAMGNDAQPLQVRPRHFSADALKGRTLLGPTRATRGYAARRSDCASVAKRARVVPVEYRHAPAALVYRRPEGSTQVVYLFLCGSDSPIRTSTLPAP